MWHLLKSVIIVFYSFGNYFILLGCRIMHLPAISLQEDSHTGTHRDLYIISLIKQDVDRNKRKMFGYVPLNINRQIPDTKTLQMSRMWMTFV